MMLITESFPYQVDDLLVRICGKLQISPTQHDLAETRYLAIGKWLEAPGSLLTCYRPVIYPQGSLRIGTTVKPLERQEFDLDLVCEMRSMDSPFPDPLKVLDLVEQRLLAHETYKPMVKRMNRCIRLNYAGEFHLDILPARPDSGSDPGCLLVPDRRARSWKHSNPKGYAAWFEAIAAGRHPAYFKRVEPLPNQVTFEQMLVLNLAVQLLKRWRDIAYADRCEMAPISIVLTTLAAQHYGGEQSVLDAVTGILEGIVGALPENGRLVVCNPSNPREDLSERWDRNADAYAAFADGIMTLKDQWRKANVHRDIRTVASTLEALFGETIAKGAIADQAKSVQGARTAGRLAIANSGGGMITVSSPNSTPIRQNTFYGK